MNREIWNGIGQIGDDLINDADDGNVRRHFIRRKRNLWIKYANIAACLCLVVGLFVPLMSMQSKNADAEPPGSGIWITGSEPQSGEPSLPWSHVLVYSLRIEQSNYSPSEQPVISLGYGLSSDVLGDGTLKINIKTGDFTTTVSTEVTVEHFTYPTHAGKEANELRIPLIPPKENASGVVTIEFLFYPDNAESAEYAEYLSSGALPVGTITLSYVADEHEIVFSQAGADEYTHNV